MSEDRTRDVWIVCRITVVLAEFIRGKKLDKTRGRSLEVVELDAEKLVGETRGECESLSKSDPNFNSDTDD